MNRRSTAGLSATDLESLTAALTAGKRATVYLRDPVPSLNLDAGTSARVVSIDGTTVTVSPKGIADQLPFEADELQRSRTSAPTAAQPRQRTVKTRSTAKGPNRQAEPVTSQRNSEPKPGARATPTTEPALDAKPAPPKSAPPKAPRRSKTSAAGLSITVAPAADGGWTVSISHGSKRQGKPAEVSAHRVARAMRELGDDAAITAVDGVIESARVAAQKRIEDLSRELESARAALENLDGQERTGTAGG